MLETFATQINELCGIVGYTVVIASVIYLSATVIRTIATRKNRD